MTDTYRIRVKHGETEIEVESSDANYVEKQFAKMKNEYLSTDMKQKIVNKSLTMPIKADSAKGMSVAEFIRSVKPKSGTDYAVSIGYYLEKIQGNGSFTGSEIKNGFLNVKFQHSNPSDTISKAKSTGKIMDGQERNSYVLTQTGEEWVEERMEN